jgi:hypothetical protein
MSTAARIARPARSLALPLALPLAVLAVGSTPASAADALAVLSTQNYVKLGDSGLFGAMSLDDEFYCETFEDGAVNTPGLSIGGGSIFTPGPTTDSVDFDDGSLNGSGTGGWSYKANAGATITISINQAALTGLPERLAFAWTDGAQNSSLTLVVTTGTNATFTRTLGPAMDASTNGGTAEDRLVSITSSQGIKSVAITASGGQGFEIDHVQYEDPVVRDLSQWNEHDFNDDSKDDILWFKPGSGSASSWLMNGLVKTGGGSLSLAVPATWQFQGVGATDQTGKTFIFWRNTASGLFHIWKLSGNEVEDEGVLENAAPLSSDWSVIAFCDVDGDIDADMILRNASTGSVVAWILDNHSLVGISTIGSSSGLTFLAKADLNGDRRDDLVWKTAGGVVKGWILNGATIVKDDSFANSGAISDDWSIHAVADLDGDGCDDLVWRNASNGNCNAWRMVGTHKASGGVIAQGVSSSWQIAGVSDLDGNGCDDLLWRHGSTNAVNGWLMDGLAKAGGGLITTVGPGWQCCSK